MAHHLQHRVLQFIGDRVNEEAIEIALEREIDHRLRGRNAALARDVGDRTMRTLHLVVEEDPLVWERPRFSAECAAHRLIVRSGNQTAARRWVAQSLALLRE